MNLDFTEFFTNHVVMLIIIISLDLFFGDPIYSLHPIRLIGRLLVWYETRLKEICLEGKFGGVLLVLMLLISVLLVCQTISYFTAFLHWSLNWVWDIYLGWSFIALGDLLIHSKNVAKAAENRNLDEVRKRVSMIVGRDTKKMDMKACGRATVESVSENLNDGVVAPLFYYCFFGITGMMIYKVLSTLDSMVGYNNKLYRDFGWFAAKLEDLMSWIPARVSWILLSVTAIFFPGFSGRNAFKVGWKDYSKLSSPNAGWSEATAAGALNIKLCGPIWREGELSQNFWLGKPSSRVGATYKDILRMNQLAMGTAILSVLVYSSLICFAGCLPLFRA